MKSFSITSSICAFLILTAIFSQVIAEDVTNLTDIVLRNSEVALTVGSNYELICDDSISEIVNSNVDYYWTKNDGSTETHINTTTISFMPFKTSDAGNYSCEIEDTYSQFQVITAQIPTPQSVSLYSHSISPVIVGSNVTLTCTVELSSAVDVSVIVNFILTDPTGMSLDIVNLETSMFNYPYNSSAIVTSFTREDSGNYTCMTNVSSTSEYLSDSDSKSVQERITVGVYLSFNKSVYHNNSLIQISEVGTDSMMSKLQCITDRKPCCNGLHKHGEWHFPDMSTVPPLMASIGENAVTFFRNQTEHGAVNLYRVKNNISSPIGLFCCVVQDAEDVNISLCVNIVNIKVQITASSDISIAGENLSLECILTGVTEDIDVTFKWLRLGQETELNDNSITTIISNNSRKLEFHPLQTFHNGNYTCLIIKENIRHEDHHTVTVIAPNITINILESSTSKLEMSYMLECNISGAENLDAKINYQWLKYNGSWTSLSMENSNSISFSSLKLYDAGQYLCNTSITSDYLNEIILLEIVWDVKLQVPAPNSVNIQTLFSNSIQHVGSNVTLTCEVKLSPLFMPDIPIVVNVQWTGPMGVFYNDTAMDSLNHLYVSTLKIESLGRSQSGNYTCDAHISTNSSNDFIFDSDAESDAVQVTTGVYLSLRGNVYANNTVIPVTDIGETNNSVGAIQNDGLQCVSDRQPCCFLDDKIGEWHYISPTDVEVIEFSTTKYFYRNRGKGNDGTINLNRRENSMDMPQIGKFCCVLPDINYENQTVCVEIVSTKLQITAVGNNIAGEEYYLECAITPQINVTFNWLRTDNNTIPVITDDSTVSSTMINSSVSQLKFNPLKESNEGNITCQANLENSIIIDVFNIRVNTPTVMVNVTSMSDETPTPGNSFDLNCSVSGHEHLTAPLITYKWTKIDTPVESNTSMHYFNNLRLSDAGEYVCSVTVISSDLLEKITSSYSYPLILTIPAPVNVTIDKPSNPIYAGSSPTLTCNAQLSQIVDVTVNVSIVWAGPRNDSFKVVSSNATKINFTKYTSTATVDAAINGEYSCEASISKLSEYINSSETMKAVSMIAVVQLPSPTNLTATALRKSVVLTWQQLEGNSSVSNFVITYSYTIIECSETMQAFRVRINNSSLRRYTIKNNNMEMPVDEDSIYYISLTAQNSVAISEPENITVSTLQAAPTGSPENVSVKVINSTSVTVSWNEVHCKDRNGKIFKYSITYYKTTMPEGIKTVINVTNASVLIASGLFPRQIYTFELAAINNNGSGPTRSIPSIQTGIPNNNFVFLNGFIIANNSIVTESKIGGEYNQALLCYTNLKNCCKITRTGDWYDPNGEKVPINSQALANMTFKAYRNRGNSVVRLLRVKERKLQMGIYQCNIAEGNDIIVSFYIGIYPMTEGFPSIDKLTISDDGLKLICISSGGPSTMIAWHKNHLPLYNNTNGTFYYDQRILHTHNATYENILTFADQANLVGLFTCIISNSRGSANMSVSPKGVIIDSSGEFIVGKNITLSCRSFTETITMKWLHGDKVVVSENDSKTLHIIFNPLNDTVHGEDFICAITRINDSGMEEIIQKNFTLIATVPSNVLNVTVTENGLRTAGENLTSICTVNKEIDGLIRSPNATWKVTESKQNDHNIYVIKQTSYSSSLVFSPLKTSHAGEYTCEGEIYSSALAPKYTQSAEKVHLVQVKIPTPRVAISLSNHTLFAGTNLSLTCMATLSDTVNSNVYVIFTWLNGTTPLYDNKKSDGSSVTIHYLSDEMAPYSSVLLLSYLRDVDSTHNFTCQAIANSTSEYITTSEAGEDSTNIFIMQRSPSAPMFMNQYINSTSTSIFLSWSQQPYDFIKGFNVSVNYSGPCLIVDNSTRPVVKPSQREFNITGLQEYSTYSIVILGYNDGGYNMSEVLYMSTLSSAPDGPPTNIRADSVTLTAITISWDPVNCKQQNSIITDYTVHYTKLFIDEPKNLSVSALETTRSTTIQRLDPSTQYAFEVRAVNKDGFKSPPINRTFNTRTPEVVGFLLHNRHYGNNSVVFSEDIGEGPSALFCLTNNTECCGSNNKDGWYFPNSSLVHLTSQHKDKIGMNVSRGASVIRLHNINNNKVPTGVFKCIIPDASTATQNLYIGIYNERNAGVVIAENLVFNREEQALYCTSSNGPLSSVTWKKDDQKLSSDSPNYVQTQNITNASSSTYVTKLFINSSDVNGSYTCTVNDLKMTSEVTQSVTVEIKGIIITGHESALPYGTPTFLNCTTDLAVETIQWLDINGNVLDNGTESFLELMIDSETSDASYTCMVQNMFGYQNKTVILRLMSKQLSTPVASSTIYVVIVVIFLTVLVLGIIIVIFVMRRKHHGKLALFSERVKRKPSSRSTRFVVHSSPLHGELEDNDGKHNNNEKLEMSTFGKSDTKIYKGEVVMIDRFGKHVEKMHEDRDKLFEIEYDSISKEPQNSHAIADIVVNRLKNRFANIFPYDHCRVKLKKVAGDENSDYINASYMDGYEKPNAYIAAQGPLPNTLEDFWKMIWENRLTTVVMLTQCFEGRKKCECYWPENINCTFEAGQGIEVILTSMTPFSEYTVRNMTVTKSTEPELAPLNVVQFHFLAWPDHGVPNNCAVMLNFVRRVRKLHPYSNPCPLLVHCSAGVGRTGTFIVLDSMLERMKIEDTLDVYDFVKKLRTQRVLMVQTQAQYIFIHDALKEVIMCGQTEIPAADIRSIIGQLNLQYSPYSPLTGFEHQFQVLNQLKYVTEEDCFSSASSEQNMRKNRYSNKLPNNFNRVQLKSTASPGSDYINASFIDGYRQRRTYIATQGPLDSTVCDFWRMVWEKESKCVVLLTKLQEQGEEMCCCYWPTHEGEAKSYGHITVKLLLEEHYGDCNLRKFEINEDKTGVVGVKTAFTVTQFHFMVWPEHETPPITSSLIELIGNVNKVQRGSGGRPMIVMCNDGVGRTGTFICIHAQLERLKTEGVFDFFQFIKSARMQRPGLITDSTQYALCHEVLADYLDSFDTYANFKEVM